MPKKMVKKWSYFTSFWFIKYSLTDLPNNDSLQWWDFWTIFESDQSLKIILTAEIPFYSLKYVYGVVAHFIAVVAKFANFCPNCDTVIHLNQNKSNNMARYSHFLTIKQLQKATVCGGFGSAACLSHDQEGRKTLTLNMSWSRWKLLAWLSVRWGDERRHYLFMSPKCRAEGMGMADPEYHKWWVTSMCVCAGWELVWKK